MGYKSMMADFSYIIYIEVRLLTNGAVSIPIYVHIHMHITLINLSISYKELVPMIHRHAYMHTSMHAYNLSTI